MLFGYGFRAIWFRHQFSLGIIAPFSWNWIFQNTKDSITFHAMPNAYQIPIHNSGFASEHMLAVRKCSILFSLRNISNSDSNHNFKRFDLIGEIKAFQSNYLFQVVMVFCARREQFLSLVWWNGLIDFGVLFASSAVFPNAIAPLRKKQRAPNERVEKSTAKCE